ncbi:hypothetical protein [Pseudomonas ovata]|uniref:hypothetical protein n=1 Tax=Pseudomonas ovata TaxID=1839709 RepID=UPI000D692975|nr:hypothetical protein [Pseudomonas ovata]
MSRWTNQNGNTAPDQTVFTMEADLYGPLYAVHGKTMGATWAHCVLGPDIAAPGGVQVNNQPSVGGEGWSTPWVGMGFPGHTFLQDVVSWKRGHLINGEWGGPGNDWRNLTILSAQANRWHTGIENHIRYFLGACRNYDLNNPMPNHWIGVEYQVVRSIDTFAIPPSHANDLYTFVPSHMVVRWRAITLPKIAGAIHVVIAHAVANRAALPVLPINFGLFAPYNVPGALAGHQGAGNYIAGAPLLHGPNANNFDQDVEIHNV